MQYKPDQDAIRKMSDRQVPNWLHPSLGLVVEFHRLRPEALDLSLMGGFLV